MNFKGEYFSDYMVAYGLHKRYFGMSGTDQEWQELIDEANKLYRDSKPFAKSLIRAVIDEFERVDRERKERGESEKG